MEYLTVISQISVLIGIWVAIYGIDSWRREHKGKRQIELAEEVLSLFYEARDVISHIRHPVSLNSENNDIQREKGESEKDFSARRTANIVFFRYNSHIELFNKIHSLRYRFMAQIGKNESIPFDELRGVENEIFRSARMLSRLWLKDHFNSELEFQQHREKIDKCESIIWDGLADEDPFNIKIEAIIVSMEKNCHKVISGAGSLHSFVNIKF